MITVEIPGYGSFKLLDANLEENLLEGLSDELKVFEKPNLHHSLLRLASLDGEQPLKMRTSWVDFMRSHPVDPVAATLVDNKGRKVWLFLKPYQNAPDGEFYTWMLIHSLQTTELSNLLIVSMRPDVVHLLGLGERGQLLLRDTNQPVAVGSAVPAAPELTAAPEAAADPEVPAAVPTDPVHVAAADGAVAAANPGDGAAAPEAAPLAGANVPAEDEDDEDAAGADDDEGGEDAAGADDAATIWDPLTSDFKNACKEIKKHIISLKQMSFKTPQKVKKCFFHKTTGKAAQLLAAWRNLFVALRKSVPDCNSEYMLHILALSEKKLATQQALPLDQSFVGAIDFLRYLERVHIKFKEVVKELQIRRKCPYIPVSYKALVNQLAKEISAFKDAAREAAVHEGVFGTLVENRVHEIVRRWVQPASLSSGAVAGLSVANQIDGIIWDHRLMPAVIEQGNVAVVEANSIAGIFELKASQNEDLGVFALRISELRYHMQSLRQSDMPEVPVLGLLIQSPKSYDQVRRLTTNTVTVLFHQQKNKLTINMSGVFDLLDFIYNRVIPVLKASSTYVGPLLKSV